MFDPFATAEPARDILLETYCYGDSSDELDFRAIIRQLTVAQAIDARRSIVEANEAEATGFECPVCRSRLTLVFQPPSRFHFRHLKQDSICPLQDDRRRNLYVRDVAYARAAESDEHVALKAKLIELLSYDPEFSQIGTGRLFSGARAGWRQPDVNAVWKGQLFAFELQLSSTYLEELVRRREVYKEQKVPMIWLMNEFDPETVTLPQVDTLALLDGLVLSITNEAASKTVETGQLHLEAIQYCQHRTDWVRRLINMEMLIIRPDEATVTLEKPAPPSLVTDERTKELAQQIFKDIVALQAQDGSLLQMSAPWRDLLSLFPDLEREFRKKGDYKYPDIWCLRLGAAVLMGQTGKVYGYKYEHIKQAADIFAEHAWDIFATLVLVLRHHELEHVLYEGRGGDGLRRKSEKIRSNWNTPGSRKFKTRQLSRDLIKRIWPELRYLVVDPPFR